MLSLDNMQDFVQKPSKNLFVYRWKFKVTLPGYDTDKIHKAIMNSKYIDPYSIETELTPWKIDASFDVIDHGFAEFMKAFIERNGWHYTVTNITNTYSAPSIVTKEDIKMPKVVKIQAPTYYPSFMKFIKVIRSGPVTVAWIKSNKKVMIRKTKKDKDDLEKAMLMLFAKSQFDSEAAFHRWFRDQMKLFKEAEDNAKNRS